MIVKVGILNEYIKTTQSLQSIIGASAKWTPKTNSISINPIPYQICAMLCLVLGIGQIGSLLTFQQTQTGTLSAIYLSAAVISLLSKLVTFHFTFTVLKEKTLLDNFLQSLVKFETTRLHYLGKLETYFYVKKYSYRKPSKDRPDQNWMTNLFSI